MYEKIKPAVHIFFVLLIAAIVSGLSLIIINAGNSLTVAAQESQGKDTPFIPADAEMLGALGIPANILQASSTLTTDLAIAKKTNIVSVTSGSLVTFTISITNNGPKSVSFTTFYDNFPSEMEDVSFDFGPKNAIILNVLANKPEWLIYDPIAIDETTFVTVTGILTSAADITIQNTAVVTPAGFLDHVSANNSSGVSVDIVGYSPLQTIYLPVIFKSPPGPVYSDNFSSSNSGWYQGHSDNDHCYSKYKSGRYQVEVDKTDHTCWRPAPSNANRRYGSFQVNAYHSEGTSNASYGIYSNGQGGSVYYLFRIWPNNSCSTGGDWDLYRKSTRVLHGDCHSAIKRGYGSGATNTLKIKHTSNGQVSVYVNNTLLDTYPDSSQLTTTGTGVYVRSSNKDIVIQFDNFKVYAP
ncbi:DUF11 domain-containing protein [Chloroflexota bacterium]